jgi:hypothetical protein
MLAREPDKHEPHTSQTDERFTGTRQPLISAGEPSAADQPGKSAFNEPALGMDGQPWWPDQRWRRLPIHPAPALVRRSRSGRQRRFQHDNPTVQVLGDPAAQMPAIATIGPDDVSTWEAIDQRGQELTSPFLCADIGSMHLDS